MFVGLKLASTKYWFDNWEHTESPENHVLHFNYVCVFPMHTRFVTSVNIDPAWRVWCNFGRQILGPGWRILFVNSKRESSSRNLTLWIDPCAVSITHKSHTRATSSLVWPVVWFMTECKTGFYNKFSQWKPPIDPRNLPTLAYVVGCGGH